MIDPDELSTPEWVKRNADSARRTLADMRGFFKTSNRFSISPISRILDLAETELNRLTDKQTGDTVNPDAPFFWEV